MLRLLLLCLGLQAPAGAHLVEAAPSEATTFQLDVDGDGVPELDHFMFSEDDQRLFFFISVDITESPTSLGKNSFRGITGGSAATIEHLSEADGFSTTFVPPQDMKRDSQLDSARGYVSLTDDEPLMATWTYGTQGTDSEVAHLVGIIIDARAYFDSGRAAPIRIYYHDAGPVASGGEPRWISLADTGIPLAPTELDAEVRHPVPRLVRFTVSTEVGLKYRIVRRSIHHAPEEVICVDGDGTEMTIEWDDSDRSESGAIFYLESFGGTAFTPQD
ncbi:hypothetical protein [Haloferula sargassicola]|uniref:Uncharacterized protein n=1 Tax=Haloferula sargassicola TaxID=490096 RepID=A0ABP9UNR2_9BACT